jgi:hypothetical protein
MGSFGLSGNTTFRLNSTNISSATISGGLTMPKSARNSQYKSFEQLKDEIFPCLRERERRPQYGSDAEGIGVALAEKAFDKLGGQSQADNK